MSPWKTKLAQLENRLQNLIEGSAARIFPHQGEYDDLPVRLVAAMRAGIQPDAQDELIAPDLFVLRAHPGEAQVLRENQPLLAELAQVIQQSGLEAGLQFLSPPVIKIVADPLIAPQRFSILAQVSWRKVDDTSTLTYQVTDTADLIPPNAFLMVGGESIYQLTQAVLNLGRRVDNHLVLKDPRISRVHAQLRAINGRFVIFDLDSSGGTYVNGERVRQKTLRPGDVISLGGFALVFGQDGGTFSSGETGETHPLVPYPPEAS